MKELKETEKSLIVGLRKNGSRNILKLAHENNIPKSTMFDTLKHLENNNIIKHKSLVNFEKLGYPIKIFMFVKTNLSQKSKLRFHLKDKANVNSLHMVDKNFDFLIEGIFKSLMEVELFVEDLEKNFLILEKQIYHVIDIISHENFLTLTEHFEEK